MPRLRMDRRTFLIATVAAGVPAAIAAFVLPDFGRPAPRTRPDSVTSDPPGTAPPTADAPIDLQPELDAAAVAGGLVHVPAGRFVLDAPLLIRGDSITIEGDGPGATVLVWTGNGAAIRNADTRVIRRQLTIRDLSISNEETPGTAGGVDLENMNDALIDHCRFERIGGQGVGVALIGTGSTYYNTIRSSWFNCSAPGSTGIQWRSGAADPNANRVIDTTISGRDGTVGVDIAGGDTALLMGCAVEGGDLVRLASSYAQLIGNRFEGGGVIVTGHNNRFVANSYANSTPFTDRGENNVRVAE